MNCQLPGIDVNEKMNQGYTHCFVVTFLSTEALAKYDSHPAHQAFVALLIPALEKVMVVDYWSGK